MCSEESFQYVRKDRVPNELALSAAHFESFSDSHALSRLVFIFKYLNLLMLLYVINRVRYSSWAHDCTCYLGLKQRIS